ncbi:MAG: hypothetical protein QXV57_08915 [Thermoproteota archaeon]
MSAYEGRVNIALAELIERAGFIERAEWITKDRRRVDVFLLNKGFRIALEGSYEALDAENDARQRIESQLCDLAVAVWYDPQFFSQEAMESEIRAVLEKSILRVKFFVPGEDVTGTLLSFLRGSDKLQPEPLVQGWLKVNVPLLGDFLNQAVQYMVSEERVKKTEGEIKRFIDEFSQSLGSADKDLKMCKSLYESFYRLYGLSVGEPENIKDLIYGKTALAILLSAVFYEGIRVKHGIPSLRSLAAAKGGMLALEEAFDRILEINYQPIFRVAREIVEKLPPDVQPRIEDLIKLARKIADNRVLLRRDFAGKIYHSIVGDWVVRKNFATYFTGVPAAYLLARLALATPNPSWRSFGSLENIESFRIADLACGSGTLLSASYEALLYLYTRDCLEAKQEVNVENFHKIALEKVFWGLDALRFATHIAATTLALHNPEVPLQNMDLYTVPLGVNSEGMVSLGSLDLAQRTLLDYFAGGTAVKVSTSTEKQTTISFPEGFNLIIMNPPFTRATGRRGRKGGGLFGFVPDKGVRNQLLKFYEKFREGVKHKMATIAEVEGFLRKFKTILGEKDVRPFLGVGQAGEGLLFLYVASDKIVEGGRIAFVLPRSVLSGVGWFLARALLASRFHLEYVIVSYDSQGGYNFSESTALSECLIIARKAREHSENENTCIVALLKKPSSALESVWLAHEIIEKYDKTDEINVITKGYHAGNYVKAGECNGIVYTVPRQLLLKHLDNWGKLLAFTNPELSIYTLELLEGKIGLGTNKTGVLIKRLGEIATIGIDRHQFHDSFQKVEDAPGALPCLYGGEEEVRSRLQAEPNAHILPKNEKARKTFKKFSSELLIPDRIRFDTAHVTSVYATQPVLSNILYAVKMKTTSSIERLKALCVWLNSTWGIMTILACRQETEGAWISLKISNWRLLPVLDVAALPNEKIEELSKVFDKFKHTDLKRLPEQYSLCQEERLNLDIEVLKALEPSIDEGEAKDRLTELYLDLSEAFKKWIG